MAKASRLPDVNSAFVKYRDKAIISLDWKKYADCFGALYTFNGLLPDKPKNYRVTISTEEYNETLKEQGLSVTCQGCSRQTDYRQVQKSRLLVLPLAAMVSGNEYEKIWICPNCDEPNMIRNSEFILRKLKEPFFLGIVPNPPERKDGIMDMITYHRKVEHWVWQMISELEAKAAEYRDDHWKRSDEDDDMKVDTSVEDGEE